MLTNAASFQNNFEVKSKQLHQVGHDWITHVENIVYQALVKRVPKPDINRYREAKQRQSFNWNSRSEDTKTAVSSRLHDT